MMRRQQQHQQRQRDQQSRVFCELSALVLSLLRPPPMPVSFPDQLPETPNPPARRRPSRSSSSSMAQISPAGFASLLLGISVALMLCGSVTFFLGFLMMPWVLGLIMVFYVAGIVSAISMVGRSVLCYALAPPSSSGKEIPATDANRNLAYRTKPSDNGMEAFVKGKLPEKRAAPDVLVGGVAGINPPEKGKNKGYSTELLSLVFEREH